MLAAMAREHLRNALALFALLAGACRPGDSTTGSGKEIE
jgi:hypothetical protein